MIKIWENNSLVERNCTLKNSCTSFEIIALRVRTKHITF